MSDRSYVVFNDVVDAVERIDQRRHEIHEQMYRSDSSMGSASSSRGAASRPAPYSSFVNRHRAPRSDRGIPRGPHRPGYRRPGPRPTRPKENKLTKDERLHEYVKEAMLASRYVLITNTGKHDDYPAKKMCSGKLYWFKNPEDHYPALCPLNLYESIHRFVTGRQDIADMRSFIANNLKGVVRGMYTDYITMVKRDNRYIGFKNCVLDRAERKFIPLNDFLVTESVPYTVIDTEVDMVELGQLRTPLLMHLMTTQNWNESTIMMFLAMLGRTWRGKHREEEDGWHCLPFSVGEAGTGKSTVLNILRLGFPRECVFDVDNSNRDAFKNAKLGEAEVILADELHSKAAGFSNDFWWKLATGDDVLITRGLYENSQETKFNHGAWLAGLKVMKMDGHGDFKSFDRRAISFPFTVKPQEVMGNISKRMVETGEIGHIMLAAEFAYQILLGIYPEKLPIIRRMEQASKQDQGQVDVIATLIQNCLKETGQMTDKVNITDFNKLYNQLCRKFHLKKPSTHVYGNNSADKMMVNGDTRFTKILKAMTGCVYHRDDSATKQVKTKRKWYIYGAKLDEDLHRDRVQLVTTGEDDMTNDEEMANEVEFEGDENPLLEDCGAFVRALNGGEPLPLDQAFETGLQLGAGIEEVVEELDNML